MRTPSPWWILAPVIILISSCIISIPLRIIPPAPSHPFFDKAEVSGGEKDIILHINEEWIYWIFTANPEYYSLSVYAFPGQCSGEIKINRGNFFKKTLIHYNINKDKTTFSFKEMSLTCDFERDKEHERYTFSAHLGPTSLLDSMDTHFEREITVRQEELIDDQQ